MNLKELLRSGGKITKEREKKEQKEREILTDPLLIRWMNNIKERQGGV